MNNCCDDNFYSGDVGNFSLLLFRDDIAFLLGNYCLSYVCKGILELQINVAESLFKWD